MHHSVQIRKRSLGLCTELHIGAAEQSASVCRQETSVTKQESQLKVQGDAPPARVIARHLCKQEMVMKLLLLLENLKTPV